MFDIGFWELSLLAVMGLLILGPERLPGVARVIGGYVRKARRTWNTVRAEIESELAADDIRNSLKKPLEDLDELKRIAGRPIDLDGKPQARQDKSESQPDRESDKQPDPAKQDPDERD